ncbi:MAG TPA: cobalt-precorrin-6A reductase [Beijerinckiaceae bacterium]|nr:cobalt-precorrin-6A reductase [Beijerinckiaceae bacterium]
MMRVLILGGSSEASVLARRIAERSDFAAILSHAGRTMSPAQAPIAVRSGGFGGAEGLALYLESERIEAVVDATHPFAAQISRNAAQACAQTNIPLLGFSRPAWTPVEGDRWSEVPDMNAAVAALGEMPRTVFLTVGRLSLSAFESARQHRYVVRTIEEVDGAQRFSRVTLIRARGPFDAAQEENLMSREGVDVLVTKNSGGAASAGKLVAGRRLGLEVVMVQRPAPPGFPVVYDVTDVLDWLEAHRPPP